MEQAGIDWIKDHLFHRFEGTQRGPRPKTPRAASMARRLFGRSPGPSGWRSLRSRSASASPPSRCGGWEPRRAVSNQSARVLLRVIETDPAEADGTNRVDVRPHPAAHATVRTTLIHADMPA